MSFSWCVYFSLKFLLHAHISNVVEMLHSVYLALLVTVISLSGIWVLEWVADQDWSGETTDKSLMNIIFALATSVGFSWEKCFDIAVTSIASGSRDKAAMKVVLAVILAALVVPAWRWFILPNVLEMSEAIAEENEVKKEITKQLQGSEEPLPPVSPKKRAELVGLSDVQLKARVAATMERLEKHKVHHHKELSAWKKAHDDQKRRADLNEAQVAELQLMLDGFAEETKQFREVADMLQLR